MPIATVLFNGHKPLRYWVLHPQGLVRSLTLISGQQTRAFEAVASSRFFLTHDSGTLAKVVSDKYRKRRAPLRWLARDYLEKRLLGQADACKEYRSLQVLRRAGLATPRCYGVGIALNPLNHYASLLLMEHITTAKLGGEAFAVMQDGERTAFLERFCHEIIQLARSGYVHRDLHYNNLLINPKGQLIWIDAHVRRLPRQKIQQWSAILAMLKADKLNGEVNRQWIITRLYTLWHS